jgi:putative Mg2+ transporter-C (MgtC) family protein
LDSFVA